jgi:FkbM family methyltransferase
MIKNIIKSTISLIGLDISRIRETSKPSQASSFFEFEESCQIPFLSEIYEGIFGKNEAGTVVEIGAFDGRTYSNSIGLIKRGWSGLFAEPVPLFFQQCKELHGNNPKVTLKQLAISDFEGTTNISVAGPLSTIDAVTKNEYEVLDWSRDYFRGEEIEVPTQTLDSLLKNSKIESGFEVLIVDVEGSEDKVFSKFNIDFWRPVLIIVELADFHPFLTSTKTEHWKLGKSILDAGYSVVYKDAINTIFGRMDHLTNVFE